MSKKFLLVAVVLCACANGISAREVALGVDSLLWRIGNANAEVKAARSGYEAKRQGISVAESAKLPTVTASLDLNYLGDGTILDRDFSNVMRDKLPHFGNTLNVNLYQPVYLGGAITAGIEMAKLQADLAAIGIDQQTDASGIEALTCYFTLMKMRNLSKVYGENITLTQKLIDNMKARYQQGTALKNDVTRYELRMSSLKYDLQAIENTISVMNHNLVTLLALEPSTIVVPQPFATQPETGTEEYWQQLTSQSSSDLLAIDKTRQLTETGLKLERASRLPSVGIVVGDQLLGPVTFEIPALNKNYNAWFAGVSIKYNLSSLWTANKKEKQKKLEIAHIADQRHVVAEALSRRVHEAYVNMIQAAQMLETERTNVRLANENYQVVETRFDNDMSLLTDMLDASTAKLDAETRLVNANINLMLSYYQLKFISGTLNKKQ